MEKPSPRNPAFAQTAFRKKVIPVIQRICREAPTEFDLCGRGLVDKFLWKESHKVKVKEEKVRLTTHLKTANGRCLPTGTVFSHPIPAGIMRRAIKNNGAVLFSENNECTVSSMKVDCERYLSVGMKGMPGRKGFTTHHNPDKQGYKRDKNGNLLKSILKNDAEDYLAFFLDK